jgi:signal transduction histidine kinase
MGSELTLAEERERRRLAMDLHDHIGQCLALAKLKLGVLRNNLKTDSLDEIIGLVDDMSRDVRSLTLEISPPILYDLGLEPAIEWLTEEFQRRFGQRIEYKVAAWSEPESLDIKVLLFRAVHELLMNVVKHARAEYSAVKLDLEGDNVRVEVFDDGQGFIFGSGGKSNPNLGFGLFTVRERLAAVGGQFEIRSEPDKGTRVILWAPLD